MSLSVPDSSFSLEDVPMKGNSSVGFFFTLNGGEDVEEADWSTVEERKLVLPGCQLFHL